MSIRCKNCGSEIPDGAGFCTRCGKKVEISENNNKFSDKKPSSSKSKTPIIITAISLFLVVVMVVLAVLFISGKKDDEKTKTQKEGTERTTSAEQIDIEDTTEDDYTTDKPYSSQKLKIGFIMLHDENSAYDKNFIAAAKAACNKLGLKEGEDYLIRTGIEESSNCKDTAFDLVDMGCNLIFANSFGHEDFMIEAAMEFPDVQFCHATGIKAHTVNLQNYHNAYASIYEGRYLTGVAAGMKLKEMISNGTITANEAKLGYVGSFTYAEVISSYTAFYLGAKSVCPSVTMDVQFTGSWYDETAEKEAADVLINRGCKVISQYSDSIGAPTACEIANIPNISYNGSTQMQCPNTYIVSSRINWQPYFEYIINSAENGNSIDADWTGTLATGSVVLADINTNVAAGGTQAKLDEVKNALQNGTLQVFDTSTFTVYGKAVDSTYKADVDFDYDYEPDTNVVITKNGITCYAESEFRSAPYFDLRIDGINLLNERF